MPNLGPSVSYSYPSLWQKDLILLIYILLAWIFSFGFLQYLFHAIWLFPPQGHLDHSYHGVLRMEHFESKVLIRSFVFSFSACGLLSVVPLCFLQVSWVMLGQSLCVCFESVLWKVVDKALMFIVTLAGLQHSYTKLQCSTTWWYFILEYPQAQASINLHLPYHSSGSISPSQSSLHPPTHSLLIFAFHVPFIILPEREYELTIPFL